MEDVLEITNQLSEEKKMTNLQVNSTIKPKLVPGDGCVNAAKNIRIELKAAFPAVKFSVRSESFSMGNAIRIHWTDGPTTKQVKEITDKYQAGSFDGMIDLYSYEHTDFKSTYGDAKYITTSRELSDSFRAEIIEGTVAKYGDQGKPTAEDWKMGRAWNVSPINNTQGERHWSWESLLYRTSVHSVPGNIVTSDY